MRYLLLLTGLVLLGGCRSSTEDVAAIGRAVAAHLDPLNGLPTAVLDEYWCRYAEEPCRERPGHVNASLVNAGPLVSAFAQERQIPVLRYDEAPQPRCAWAAEDSTSGALYAEFVHPPYIEGDSARVLLATICADGEAFEQVHEFVLRRREGRWVVERRALVSIT